MQCESKKRNIMLTIGDVISNGGRARAHTHTIAQNEIIHNEELFNVMIFLVYTGDNNKYSV